MRVAGAAAGHVSIAVFVASYLISQEEPTVTVFASPVERGTQACKPIDFRNASFMRLRERSS